MSKSSSFDFTLNAEAPSGTGAPDTGKPLITTARGGTLKSGQTEGDKYAEQVDATTRRPQVESGFIPKFRGI